MSPFLPPVGVWITFSPAHEGAKVLCAGEEAPMLETVLERPRGRHRIMKIGGLGADGGSGQFPVTRKMRQTPHDGPAPSLLRLRDHRKQGRDKMPKISKQDAKRREDHGKVVDCADDLDGYTVHGSIHGGGEEHRR
jgi:hypothetical protein